MKFSRSMMAWGLVLSLSGIFGAMSPVLAQDEELTTAKDVVEAGYSKEALKKFVESARDHFAGLEFARLLTLGDLLREEGGDWNYMSMYLVVLTDNGTAFYHGEDPTKDNMSLIDEVDDNGKMVVKMIVDTLIEMDEEEVFVEYTSDDQSTADLNPRYCYALKGGHPALPDRVFILVGGYHNKVTTMDDGDESEDLPEFPEVSAMDVRDRETLKAFVQGAGDWAIEALPALDFDLPRLETIFKLEGGHWKSGSTYVFLMTLDGNVLFHGARPDQENLIQVELVDRNGLPFIKELLEKAISGGGYVDYYWDDPGVEGDEELGSAKVGYARTFTVPEDYPSFGGAKVVAGSGFYKGNQLALDFAHFANGGGITSDVVVVNASANAVRPNIYFYNKMGELIDAASVVDAMGQGLEVTSYRALTVPNAIPPLGEVTIPTHGMGDLMTGSVKVVSDSTGSPIGGVLRFDLIDGGTRVGVAGVGASQAVRDVIFPARRMAGGINTGAAFRNLSESNQVLTCRLMKDGQHLGDDAMVDLPANGQDAKFIHELFDYDTSDFTGSVRCTSPAGEQEFTAVALELDPNNSIFTTLPVVPVAMDGSGSGNGNQVTLYFAHFANGGGITSDIVVVNAAGTAVQPDIYFYDKMGELIDAGSVLDVMGEGLEVTDDGALTVPNPIPPLGEVTIPTHGMGTLMTGSVKVVSDSSGSSIGGVLRFDLIDGGTRVGVAGVGASQPVRGRHLFRLAAWQTGSTTGAAFRNLSDSNQILTCRLMKDGQQLGDDAMVDLPANGQDAKFIHELFDHDTSDFTGSVRCTSPAGDAGIHGRRPGVGSQQQRLHHAARSAGGPIEGDFAGTVQRKRPFVRVKERPL